MRSRKKQGGSVFSCLWVLLKLVLCCVFREENILLFVGFKGAMEVHGLVCVQGSTGEVRVQVDIVLTPTKHLESNKARNK